MRDYRDSETLNRPGRGREGPSWGDERDSGGAFFRSGDDRQPRGRSSGGWGGLMGDRDEQRDRSSSRDWDRTRSSRRDERSQRQERDPEFGSDAYHSDIPMDETRSLIASNKVEGTPVYGRDGDRIGSIHNFMVDKRSGNVVYAVLKGSGGFLGMNQHYYPIDWRELTYDTRVDGYCIDMTEDDLDNRRSFDERGREHRYERGRDRNSSFGRNDRDRW